MGLQDSFDNIKKVTYIPKGFYRIQRSVAKGFALSFIDAHIQTHLTNKDNIVVPYIQVIAAGIGMNEKTYFVGNGRHIGKVSMAAKPVFMFVRVVRQIANNIFHIGPE
jgi:hypothetical protein